MQVKNTLIRLAAVVAVLFPVAMQAQTNSINAFSPYTMYGIGELNTPGTLPMRSMGGVGVAQRGVGVINLLNPAAYSAMPQKSFLFDFGLEGQNYYNYQKVGGQSKSTAYNTFNFHDVAFLLPLAKKLGLGFSLTPYSSVGYRTKFDQPYSSTDPNNPWADVGRVQYIYQGEGDVTEVKLGVGWEVFKNFSLGLALQYYWGDIDRTFRMIPTSITGTGDYGSTSGNTNYGVSSFKGQVGVQWSPIMNTKRLLTVGATYDFGGDLNPEVKKRIYNNNIYNAVVKGDTTHMSLVLPRQLAAGVYYQTTKWAVGVDYVFQNWGGRNTNNSEMTGTSGPNNDISYKVAYTNTSTVKMGVEFTPDRYDIRSFLSRWSYRAGFRYGNYNQTFGGNKLSQYAVTLGFGIPVRFYAISGIDVGFEYGRRGYNVAERVGLVQQQYFKFAVGFTLFAGAENSEYWFTRPKYE